MLLNVRRFVLRRLTEHDLITIGDGAVLEELVNVQPHTFEDKVMKLEPIVVAERAYLGANVLLFPGCHIGTAVTLDPLTLVMKRERLEPFTRWSGSPANYRGRVQTAGAVEEAEMAPVEVKVRVVMLSDPALLMIVAVTVAGRLGEDRGSRQPEARQRDSDRRDGTAAPAGLVAEPGDAESAQRDSLADHDAHHARAAQIGALERQRRYECHERAARRARHQHSNRLGRQRVQTTRPLTLIQI